MAQKTNKLVALCLYYVVEAGGYISQRELFNQLTTHIDDEKAYNARLNRLRLTPSETRSETIWKGKEFIARQILARCLWYKRLVAWGPKGERTIGLGEPPTKGGRYARTQSWDEYFLEITPYLDSDIHPTSHDFADPQGKGRVKNSGYGYGPDDLA